MAIAGKYEIVVGLEVHAQLQTKSKLFCGDPTAYGAPPNTQVSTISLAHPGTLPKLNKEAISLAISMGIACNCTITRNSYFSRKNYFYPDLPKGFQVTQDTHPICQGGFITIDVDGAEKNIRLNRIHMEEDAGKSLHDVEEDFTSIDYNRAGTPLIEIVSEPDIRSSEEAFAYVSEIRRMVRYLGICDGNMEEGSLRCDVNISVRPAGSSTFGTRVEVKNLNSIRNVKRAIESEAERLIDCLEKGVTIIQETRSFDADTGTSFSIREKEDAHDYRYFPEPDLPPFHIHEEMISSIRQSMPQLPRQRILKYRESLQLSDYDARVISEEREFADYFEDFVATNLVSAKTAANWMLGPVKTWLNESQYGINVFPLRPERLAAIASLAENGVTSFSAASTKIFSQMITDPAKDPAVVAKELNLVQESGVEQLVPVIEKVLLKFPEKVMEYRKGKKGLLALFVGEVMKQTKGKADPKITNELLLEKLKS